MEKILKKLSNCRCLSLSYQDIIVGVFKRGDRFVQLYNNFRKIIFVVM